MVYGILVLFDFASRCFYKKRAVWIKLELTTLCADKKREKCYIYKKN